MISLALAIGLTAPAVGGRSAPLRIITPTTVIAPPTFIKAT